MIRGQFDVSEARLVTGWAVDADDPSACLRVELFLDDAKLGEAIAGVSTPLGAAEALDAHPFTIALAEPVAPDDRSRIRALITPVVEVDTAAMTDAALRIAGSGVFDHPFYAAQLGEPVAGPELILHYLARGEREGLAPHPLFDAAFAAAQLGHAGVAIGPTGALAAYLAHPNVDIDPHPLFETRRFRGLATTLRPGVTGLEQYLAAGGSQGAGVSPCVLFDADHYLSVNTDVLRSGVDPLIHFIKSGAQEGRAPHPLFCASHLRRELGRRNIAHPPEADLLAFYMSEPQAWPASPHPLFDPDHYAKVRADAGLAATPDEPPLAAMLRRHDDLAPGPWFDTAFHRAQAAQAGVSVEGLSVIHYAKHNARYRFDPHPLFSLRHAKARGLRSHRSSPDPLADFIDAARSGHEAGFLGSEASLADAARALLASALDASSSPKGQPYGDPHPLFEQRLYAARNRTCVASGEPPLTHYARVWGESGLRFPPWGTALHPRRDGVGEHGPFDVIFVSHELTRTGAPAILLKIIEDLTRRRGVRGLTLAVKGGERLEEFRTWTPVVDMSVIRAAGLSDTAFLEDLVGGFSPSARPKLALVNTACADHVGPAFAAAGIPVVTLVHEIASAFPARVFENIYACSQRVIYPAQFVCQEAHKAHDLPTSKDAIAPQGLLDPKFGKIDPERARRDLLEELELPHDAFIVLNAGTLDLRKGVDVFARVAAQVERRRVRDGGAGPPVHFVWLGDGERRAHSPFGFVMEDLRRMGVEDRVHFPGARPNPEPYFAACDAFLLTSRLDPFPCVVHEAMACAKPVVVFAGAGGASEAVADGAGVVIDYGDIDAMAAAVLELSRDKDRCAALGAKARARIEDAYGFTDYVDRLANLIAEGASVDLGDPLAVSNRPGRSARRVLFSASRWELSAQSRLVGSLIEGLNRRGFEAELVITTRDPLLGALDHLPDVPTTILPDTLRRPSPFQDVWRRLGALLGGSGTAVLAPVFDEIGEALTPILPREVGVLAVGFDGDPGLEERAERLGRYWQRAVATSVSIAEMLLRAAPCLEGRLASVPCDPVDDIASDGVCDAYAELLEEMFVELRAGTWLRPRPAYTHPELDSLSLPPSLIRHPDFR